MSELFYKLPIEVATRRDITPADKLIYAAIVGRMGDNQTSWAGKRTLARDVGVNPSTVVEATSRLESVGLLIVEHGSNGQKSIYSLPGSGRKIQPVEDEKRTENPTGTKQQKRSENPTPRSENPTGSGRKIRPELERSNNKRGKKGISELEFPSNLNTPEFKTAWAEWETHRREIKKPLTPTSAKRQLSTLAGQGPEMASKMIGQSIERGWVGLFPVKSDAASSKPSLAEKEFIPGEIGPDGLAVCGPMDEDAIRKLMGWGVN